MHNNLQYQVFTEQYGTDPHQTGDLYIPTQKSKGTVCLFHGGFWKMPYDKSQLDAVAVKLVENNFSVWNIEYRRVGYLQQGYPETFIDAIEAINVLAPLSEKYPQIDLSPVYIAGHSAGGHLSLWLGNHKARLSEHALNIIPDAFIGLAPVVDLVASYRDVQRREFITAFLGCTPDENRDIYQHTSPIAQLPAQGKQVIFHGEHDEVLPIGEIDDYARHAQQKGTPVECITIAQGTHMDFCDPDSQSISRFIDWLDAQSESR
ncbi:alpha/beta hydrolase [Candidatus Symbiopectobacterium sp. NZEC151]|uniref:alpha/beta hydrolase n=2 Tax=unclassified Symbiopectobacterium TaxID=2794573 RepID=UPI002226A637|nr:alpha/beta hydrolase [Candidatus Symbiopectobacterium sp. NZEC151]MCW2474029.1 alpha/beta hydrolase [Candidatus Symbiopectobacterium sp. NZEC151]